MIYEYITSYCDKKKITVAELERKCNLGRGSIGKWRKSTPSLDNLKKVSDYTKISMNVLVRESLEKGV